MNLKITFIASIMAIIACVHINTARADEGMWTFEQSADKTYTGTIRFHSHCRNGSTIRGCHASGSWTAAQGFSFSPNGVRDDKPSCRIGTVAKNVE